MHDDARSGRVDLATGTAIGIVVYALANLIHEGLGHGGACVAVGCRPMLLTSMHFEGDASQLSRDAGRFIAIAGSLANIFAAIPALIFLRAGRPRVATLEFAAWLFASVNLLQASSYLLFSGVACFGDWIVAVRGVGPLWLQRLSLTFAGAATYWFTVQWSMAYLSGLVGGDLRLRAEKAYRVMVPVYVAGGALYIAACAFSPGGIRLVLVSAIAASLGATSGFAWGPQLLNDPHLNPPSRVALAVERDPRWWLAALCVLVLFVVVLGPGVALS
jgi:hypothetical protein